MVTVNTQLAQPPPPPPPPTHTHRRARVGAQYGRNSNVINDDMSICIATAAADLLSKRVVSA